MILYEFEGKKLLSQGGISVPWSQLIDTPETPLLINLPVVVKAQVLSGKRADVGGILFAENNVEFREALTGMLGKTINNEKVEKVLIEEKINYDAEYYLSISYDTDTRGVMFHYSESGGTGIEDRGVEHVALDILNPTEFPEKLEAIFGKHLLEELFNLFLAQDCLLIEINPLIKIGGGWIALDAKIKLDDNAAERHPDWDFSPRSAPGHTPTVREIEAKKIDEGDYRGVAGSAFFDLPGDIAIMASGGGASITALDTLIREGGKPANYTEYGGNPPKEKVFKLTKVVLNRPNLHGLWVVGALANFTNIYETLSGFVEGLREVKASTGQKLDFPIVIRRAGPHDAEAREMLKEVKDFDIHLYGEETSITESAKIVAKLAKEYAQK
jgi:succinyl-CoA synthetase beta subunit